MRMQIVTEGRMQPTTCGCKKLKMPRALILNSVSEFPRRTSQANDSRHISSSERGLIGTYDARAQQDPRHIVRSFVARRFRRVCWKANSSGMREKTHARRAVGKG